MDRLNTLPSRIKVGWAEYRIENWHPGEATGARRYGETNQITRTIRIDTSHSPAQSAETLLHEILHCLFDIWNLDDKDDEERTVHGLAAGLTTVWRDNPDVFAWIDMNLTGVAV